MGRVYLLDCTLRDGGYVNDWRFGKDTIKGFGHKIAQTGIEMFEVGFLKGDSFDEDRAVFPDFDSLKSMIQPKDKKISPALASLFALCFAVTITIAWEYYEFTMDRLYGLNLQNSAYNSESGLIDTMVDLILGSAGALTGMFVTAFTKNKVKCKKK